MAVSCMSRRGDRGHEDRVLACVVGEDGIRRTDWPSDGWSLRLRRLLLPLGANKDKLAEILGDNVHVRQVHVARHGD